MSEKNYPAIPDPEGVERVYGELLARAPKQRWRRLDAVARAVEILLATAHVPRRSSTSPAMNGQRPAPPA